MGQPDNNSFIIRDRRGTRLPMRVESLPPDYSLATGKATGHVRITAFVGREDKPGHICFDRDKCRLLIGPTGSALKFAPDSIMGRLDAYLTEDYERLGAAPVIRYMGEDASHAEVVYQVSLDIPDAKEVDTTKRPIPNYAATNIHRFAATVRQELDEIAEKIGGQPGRQRC